MPKDELFLPRNYDGEESFAYLPDLLVRVARGILPVAVTVAATRFPHIPLRKNYGSSVHSMQRLEINSPKSAYKVRAIQVLKRGTEVEIRFVTLPQCRSLSKCCSAASARSYYFMSVVPYRLPEWSTLVERRIILLPMCSEAAPRR